LRTPGMWTADLVPEQMPPFVVEPGCKIKSPARYFCIDVEKTNVAPTPPLQVVGLKAQDYLCYVLSCPVPVPTPSLPVADQFGQGTTQIRKNQKLICAPAYKVGVPTPTPTATPTPPPPTTTPTPCGCVGGPNNGLPCTVNVDCPGGFCPCPSPT